MRAITIVNILLLASVISCDSTPNSPYPESERAANVYFSSFDERPRFLDPARVYSTNESAIIEQIYEPPLQYDYLKRPYELIPLSAAQMPTVTFLDAHYQPLPKEVNHDQVAFTRYDIEILPNMLYQPHPALAKNEAGQYRYHQLTSEDVKDIHTLSDFKYTGTRAVTAEDFVYEIKRLADPDINSPIYGFMKEYIVGLKELHDDWSVDKTFEGAKAIDATHYSILIRGKYLQFPFWLAMAFFSPMPWEADIFYSNPLLIKKNIVLDWYPIGSGPYYLSENNPNRRMVLSRNPNFHGELFQGKPMPFIDGAIFALEKEDIPRWNKFLQGYYDASGLSSDNFDQAIRGGAGQATLTPELAEKGISLLTDIRIADFYWGFNMLDDVVGGDSERAHKLRQAISIAINMEEYISIFLNERAIASQSILPPGIYGYEPPPEGINPYVYEWENNHLKRRPIEYAKQLMSEAGYPKGIDPHTGKPLIIYYDASGGGDPGEKPRYAWLRKQFDKLGIDLNVRITDSNRFRQKLEEGNAQFFGLGWVGDYPDPENFFMILYGKNGKKEFSGVNSTNYDNSRFDDLFQEMRKTENSPKRLAMIKEMTDIIQRDAPMVFGYVPQAFTLKQPWYGNVVVSGMAGNTLKYQTINADERIQMQRRENKPAFWPAVLVIVLLVAAIVPVWREYNKRVKTQHARRIRQP